MIYSWMDYFNERGELVKEVHPTLRGNVFRHAIDGQPLGGCPTLVVRRSVVEEVQGFDESLPRGNDGDFIRRVCLNYEVDLIPEVLVKVHIGHLHERISDNSEQGIRNAIKSQTVKFVKFREHLKEYPRQTANIYAHIAYSHAQLGEWSSCFRYYFKALRTNPQSTQIYASARRSVLLILQRSQIYDLLRRIKRKVVAFNSSPPKIDTADVEVYIVSYPKSGRTWLRVLLGKYLCEHFGLDESEILNAHVLTRLAHVPITFFTHDGSQESEATVWSELPDDKSASRYSKSKVIFLVREPKDTLVSSHFQNTLRARISHGSMSETVRDERLGIRKILAFHNIWHKNQHVPKEFLLLRYEELHNDPASCLRSVLEFIGIDEISEKAVENAVAFAHFDNMRHLERSGELGDKRLKPGSLDDQESYKTRRGIVGGYTDYLTDSDILYIDQMAKAIGNPYYPSTHATR